MFTWSDIFTGNAQSADEAQANADNQARRLAEQTAARQAAGTITPERVAMNQAAIDGATNFASTQNAAASAGFGEGIKDGLRNVKDAVTGWGPFKVVPIWVYVAVGLGLFVYLGGLQWLRKKLKV